MIDKYILKVFNNKMSNSIILGPIYNQQKNKTDEKHDLSLGEALLRSP